MNTSKVDTVVQGWVIDNDAQLGISPHIIERSGKTYWKI